MSKFRELLDSLSFRSKTHNWHGISPDCIAVVLSRGARSCAFAQQALLVSEYPFKRNEVMEYVQQFPDSEWKLAGHVVSYRLKVGTGFEPHPSPEFGEAQWEQMLAAPVLDSAGDPIDLYADGKLLQSDELLAG
jgi:hypothetical protein